MGPNRVRHPNLSDSNPLSTNSHARARELRARNPLGKCFSERMA